eukprot:EG_transcript_18474
MDLAPCRPRCAAAPPQQAMRHRSPGAASFDRLGQVGTEPSPIHLRRLFAEEIICPPDVQGHPPRKERRNAVTFDLPAEPGLHRAKGFRDLPFAFARVASAAVHVPEKWADPRPLSCATHSVPTPAFPPRPSRAAPDRHAPPPPQTCLVWI